jgi:hypothetical protein
MTMLLDILITWVYRLFLLYLTALGLFALYVLFSINILTGLIALLVIGLIIFAARSDS